MDTYSINLKKVISVAKAPTITVSAYALDRHSILNHLKPATAKPLLFGTGGRP